MKNKITVTIGIPAYNEERSLPQVLESLKNIGIPDGFELKEVILISDGSTDKTPEIINGFSMKGINIRKIIDDKRKGKIYRLNHLFSSSKTKYLVVIDADIRLKRDAIKNLLVSADLHKSLLTVSHQVAIKPNNLIGKIIFRGYELWSDIRTIDEKHLDTHQNFYGASSVYDYDFYHSLKIPQEFQDERKYIYFSAKQKGKFHYEKNSIIYYLPVSTYKDFYVMSSRSDGIDEKIQKIFGGNITKNHEIPLKHKLKIVMKHFLISPFETAMFLIMKYWTILTKKSDPLKSKGMWTMTTSTKVGYRDKHVNK